MKQSYLLLLFLAFCGQLFSQTPQTTEISSEIIFQHVEDVDHDGDLDILGRTGGPDGYPMYVFSWMENVGGVAGFSAPRIHDTPFGDVPYEWDVFDYMDLNGDNRVDVVLNTDYFVDTLRLLLSTAQGNYDIAALHIDYSLKNKVKFVDVNSDDILDVLIAEDHSDEIRVKLGLGNGQFDDLTTFFTFPYSIFKSTWGDIDNDGDNDLITYRGGFSNTFQIFINQAGLLTPGVIVQTNNSSPPIDMTIVPLAIGTELQFTTVVPNSSIRHVYRSHYNPTTELLSAPQIAAVFHNSTFAGPIERMDLDGDGDLDWIKGFNVDQLEAIQNNGFGNDSEGPFNVGPATTGSPLHTVIADFSPGGFSDLVRQKNNKIYLDKNFRFNFPLEDRVTISRLAFKCMTTLDIDGDQIKDIIIYDNNENRLYSMFGLPDNHFSYPYRIVDSVANYNIYSDDICTLSTYDFDSDGDGDLFFHVDMGSYGTLKLFQNTSGGYLTSVDAFDNPGYEKFSLVDDDNDGDLDLISGYNYTKEVFRHENTGSIYSSREVIYSGRSFVSATDIDGDGVVDIAVENQNSSSSMEWLKMVSSEYENQGQLGLFAPSSFYYRNNENNGFHDLTGNGRSDLMRVRSTPTSSNTFKFQVFVQSDTIAMYNEVVVDSVAAINDGVVIFSDVNYDNLYDLIHLDEEVHYYRSLGDGNMDSSQVIYAGDANHNTFAFSDINNDDIDDFIFQDAGLKTVINQYAEGTGVISGVHFWDENNNNIMDSSEVGLADRLIHIPHSSIYRTSDRFGRYAVRLIEDTHELHAYSDDLYEVQSDSIGFLDLSSGDTVEYNISYHTTLDSAQAEISLTTGILRCDTEMPIWISITNVGGTRLNGRLTIELDSLLPILSSDIDTLTQSGSNLIIDSPSLIPGQSYTCRIGVQVPDFNFIDSLFTISAILRNPTDSMVIYDSLTHTDFVRCAYDPNDKQVHPSFIDFPNYALTEEPLQYTIRFQNTGNDTAFNVRIEDPIEPILDLNSVEVLSTSHPWTYDRVGDRLHFYFNNIALPDSSTNFTGSQGFIKFQIHHKMDALPPTDISNRAEIFFDTNPPIITNAVTNTLVDTYPVDGLIGDALCGPAPTGSIQIDFPFRFGTYQWSDGQLGSIRTGLFPGMYTVSITDTSGRIIGLKTFSLEAENNLAVAIESFPTTTGLAEGSLIANPSGGTPPYTYVWSTNPVQTTPTVSNLQAGMYTVTVTDESNCSYVQTGTVEVLTSTKKRVGDTQLLIVPNPTSGLFQLQGIAPNRIQSCSTYNTLGKRMAMEVTGKQFRLTDAPPGFYYVVVTAKSGKRWTIGLVVQNE